MSGRGFLPCCRVSVLAREKKTWLKTTTKPEECNSAATHRFPFCRSDPSTYHEAQFPGAASDLCFPCLDRDGGIEKEVTEEALPISSRSQRRPNHHFTILPRFSTPEHELLSPIKIHWILYIVPTSPRSDLMPSSLGMSSSPPGRRSSRTRQDPWDKEKVAGLLNNRWISPIL